MEFWRLYRVIRQRKKVIVAVTLAALIASFLVAQRKAGDYTSTVTLTVPTAQQFYFVSSANGSTPNSDSLVALAMDLIRSREIADRVIQQLQLSTPASDLENRIVVSRDPNSTAIRITAQASTPSSAVALANAFGDNTVAYDQELQRGQATLAREFVEKQVADTQARLSAAEDALLTYQQGKGAVLITGPAGQAPGLESQLEQSTLDLNEAKARLVSLAREMHTQQPTRMDQYLYQNPVAQQLETQLVQLQVQLTSQLAVHTEQYPAVITIEAMIKQITDELNGQIQKTVAAQQSQHNPIYDALAQEQIAAETDILALQAKQTAIQRALAAATQNLPTAEATSLAESRLTRTTQLLGTQLTDLSGQLAQARIREQEVQSLESLSVLDHARSATQSPFAGLRYKLMLGLMLGLIGGLALAFFLEYLDNSLKTPEAAERLLGVPALVSIPKHNPPYDEAYRMLRINLAAHERGTDGADAIMLTAARPRAGTSTVTANLARAFAQAGRRTIVVDAALARPAQHRLFDVPNDRGLLQVLDGTAGVDDVLMPAGRNLWILPAGAPASDENDATLGSPSMSQTLRALRQRGDIVLVDTSPAGAFADAFDIAPLTSGALMVLDANEVPRGAEEQIKLQFDRLRTPVLGAVLTKVDPARVDSYFYQEKFYRESPRRSYAPVAAASAVVLVLAAALCADLATSPSKPSSGPAELQHFSGEVAALVQAVTHTTRTTNERRERYMHAITAFAHDSVLEPKIRNRTATVGVIGLGYVGLALAVETAREGFPVIGIDIDPARVASLGGGRSYVADVRDEDVAALIESRKLSATTNYGALEGADIVIICVPTPLTKSKEPDLSFVTAATKDCLPWVRQGMLIVLESTTYPGTTVEVIKPMLETRGFVVGEDVALAFSPERIDPGNARHTFRSVPKIVGGLTPSCAHLAETFYGQIVDRVVSVSSPTVAEMVKVYENVFRNVNIALVNELTLLCDRMGLDVWEIIDAASTKPYGFMPFYPGPGIGGHCIPVDPYYLSAKAREYDFHARFIELAATVNDSMPYYVVSRTTTALETTGKRLRGAKVLLLGVAYKRDLGDVRMSPALKVLELLEKRGAMVAYHDPFVPQLTVPNPGMLSSVPLTEDMLSGVDCVILTTDHSNVDYDLVLQSAPLIIDTRNRLRDFQASHVVRL